MSQIGTVASIHRFPVKSMQGEALDASALDADGIVDDRTWALRDVETGKLVSAKRPRLWRAMLECGAVGTGDDVVVTLPDGRTFDIGDDALAAALGELFGRPVEVERATGDPQQGVYASDWPEVDGVSLAGELDFPTNLAGTGSRFVDVADLHLVASSSLNAVAELGEDLDADVRRLRPSLVIDTADAPGFVENDWRSRTLSIGDQVTVAVDLATPRCVMPTVAQNDLPEQRGLLRMLAEHNLDTNPLGSFACLGVYASVHTTGTVRVGDPVTLG